MGEALGLAAGQALEMAEAFGLSVWKVLGFVGEVLGLAAWAVIFCLASVPLAILVDIAHGFQYRRQRFGLFWGTVLHLTKILDTDMLQQKHWDINSWSDAEVLNWKASHLASCNAISVAVCIPQPFTLLCRY